MHASTNGDSAVQVPMNDHAHHTDMASATPKLTALVNARAKARFDETSRKPETVGWMLAAYRLQAGLTLEALAAWLAVTLPMLADLAEETRPWVADQDRGLIEIAEMYGVDPTRLLEAFERGDP
jgi:hypothetical protein